MELVYDSEIHVKTAAIKLLFSVIDIFTEEL